jgi:putative transposase
VFVTEPLKLAPDNQQRKALLATMRACNTAANHAAAIAYQHHTASKPRVQKLCYRELRSTYKVSAQMAIRAIAKACDAYRRDKLIQPVFRAEGAIAYDPRILAYKGRNHVSVLTLEGRILVPLCFQGRWRRQYFDRVRGEADLVHRDGSFYLVVAIDVPEPPQDGEPEGWLGVDLGIKHLATDATGRIHTGKAVRAVRYRNRKLRQRLQRKNTKSAKRLLKKRRRKEARFARNTNHVISKTLVGKAQDTRFGIALEDLTGIRERVTVSKAQRADQHSWGFAQLRQFIAYKAAIAGVPVRHVDPRNTSRTCPACGYCDKRNRRTRDEFECVRCGFAGPADHVAAVNIGRRAVRHAADDAA